MQRSKMLLLSLLFIPMLSFSNVVCPPEDLVKKTQLDFPMPMPNPEAPWTKDYMVMGNINYENENWYVVDGIFTGVKDENDALAKGKGLLELSKVPMGPYNADTQVNLCIYHHSIFSNWDRRPKFVIAVNSPQMQSAQEILKLLRGHVPY